MLLELSYVGLFGFWALSYFVLIPVTLNLVVTAVCIIIIGAHRSLKLTEMLKQVNDDGTEAQNIKIETLTAKDAYMFPVFGSISLFGLYCAFKYLDPYYVQLLLSGYFSLAGVFTLTATFVGIFNVFSIFQTFSKCVLINQKFRIPYIQDEIVIFMSLTELISMICGGVLTYFYMITKHYMLNNLIGIAFCIQGIENISIGSVQIASILLVGLFFYDIFWVFGTEVMVSVAKNVKGPLLLLFPRKFADLVAETKGEFSMLGLGDIVIPGLFLALLLRLDTVLYLKTLITKHEVTCQGTSVAVVTPVKTHEHDTRSHSAVKQPAVGEDKTATTSTTIPAVDLPTLQSIYEHSYSKHYFLSTIAAYTLGLLLTVFVMYYFQAAQPALLYLVPCCLIAAYTVALVKGQFSTEFWGYNEESKEGADTPEVLAEDAKKK